MQDFFVGKMTTRKIYYKDVHREIAIVFKSNFLLLCPFKFAIHIVVISLFSIKVPLAYNQHIILHIARIINFHITLTIISY